MRSHNGRPSRRRGKGSCHRHRILLVGMEGECTLALLTALCQEPSCRSATPTACSTFCGFYARPSTGDRRFDRRRIGGDEPASLRPCRKAATRWADRSIDMLLRNPITGTTDCARAASGHVTAPPRNPMHARCLMCSPLTMGSAYHTARGEAAFVHHSKFQRMMSLMGHERTCEQDHRASVNPAKQT